MLEGFWLGRDFTDLRLPKTPTVQYCQTVQKEINLTLNLTVFILDILPNILNDHLSYLFILFLITKKYQSLYYKKPEPPNIVQWRERIKLVYVTTKAATENQHRETDHFSHINVLSGSLQA